MTIEMTINLFMQVIAFEALDRSWEFSLSVDKKNQMKLTLQGTNVDVDFKYDCTRSLSPLIEDFINDIENI